MKLTNNYPMMKKIALLFIAMFALGACSLGDDGPKYTLEVLPVESYVLPESFGFGETYPITIRYKRPTNCYAFEGFYYEKNGNDRIVGITARKQEGSDCAADDSVYEATFNFTCTVHGSYRFRFYKGDNTDGTPIFEDVEVQVTY